MITRAMLLASATGLFCMPPANAAGGPALLFHLSADKGLTADVAGGEAEALFADGVKIVPDGRLGAAVEAGPHQVLAWSAPGNIHAQRGTLSFFWRAREAVGRTEFPLFRVGYADHSSWDMTWLRIDWNGSGFDAFVTDNGLARSRVSYKMHEALHPERWVHIAFSWDEAEGVRLYIDGAPAGRLDRKGIYDASLYAFGPHSRIISPYQVHSRYSFMRGGDVDEIRIYDRALAPAAVAGLAKGERPKVGKEPLPAASLERFRARHGWTGNAVPPPYLSSPQTRIRKVEFADARDLKQWNWKGNDGIRETTWPGVYNRSRIEGRNDYFQLPDWNVYSEGGKTVTYRLPDEHWNHLEIVGPASGSITASAPGSEAVSADRPRGTAHTWHRFAPRKGGTVLFRNAVQESPIQEIGAYHVSEGGAPVGTFELAYRINARAAPDQPALAPLRTHIEGRYPEEERSIVAALPAGAPAAKLREGRQKALPIVHLLVPTHFQKTEPGGTLQRFNHGWDGLNAGLDGMVLELPALHAASTASGLIPLNIRVKDPLWPDRDMMDVNVSVKPGEARSLWLDLRDRLLPEGQSLYLTISSAAADFGADDLDGAELRLVFKDRAAATIEHEADRFQQVRDNMAFVVEEHPRDKRLALFDRLDRDLRDLLRANPDHEQGRAYFAEIHPFAVNRNAPLPETPAGVPRWAFLQTENLKRVSRFVNWWIDERQVANGEFGGGLSDDSDMIQQWPGLALMGVEPDKIRDSVNRLVEATYANGMFTNGLSTIKTDELHSYEEGINAISAAMYLSYGDPKLVGRMMETARAYSRLVEVNPAGHAHVVSNYFSGSDVVRESVWEWSKPYSYLIFHPGILLADYNGAPAMKALVTELADGWLAHARREGGDLLLPAEINWRSDAERDDLRTTPGGPVGLQLFAAAHRFSGNDQYVEPIRAWAKATPSIVSGLNTNPLGPNFFPKEPKSNFERFEAWRATGDKTHLATLYADEIRTADRRMYMVTEGHWWSDRVELSSDLLQRSRLGGGALRRNQIVPGHLVSWRFGRPGAAEQVALLVSGSPTRFKVIAFNLDAAPVSATMTGWGVNSGRWKVVQGMDTNGDDRIDGKEELSEVLLERSVGTDLHFPGRSTTIVEFSLEDPSIPAAQRQDVAIGDGDLALRRNGVEVIVHSLGALPVSGGSVILSDASGKELGSASFGAIGAAADLIPKSVKLLLPTRGGDCSSGCLVRVRASGAAEITTLNNVAALTPRRQPRGAD